jgi:hypothetical protein
MKRAGAFLFLISIILLAVACSPIKDRTCDVSGTVNLDKKPLTEGDITFLDTSGRVPISMKIQNGSYHGKAHAGEFRVEIRAYRVSEKAQAPGPGIDNSVRPKENYIPQRFNTASELKEVHITPQGRNQFDYDIESK